MSKYEPELLIMILMIYICIWGDGVTRFTMKHIFYCVFVQREAVPSGSAGSARTWKSPWYRPRPVAHRSQRHLQEVPGTQQRGLHGETDMPDRFNQLAILWIYWKLWDFILIWHPLNVEFHRVAFWLIFSLYYILMISVPRYIALTLRTNFTGLTPLVVRS